MARATYHEFRKQRAAELCEAGYDKKQIQRMISEEWKAKDGNGNSITARKTTLQNELKKNIAYRVPQFDTSKVDWLQEILEMRNCIYCDVKLDRKSIGDHFIPLARDFETQRISNFSCMTVPCCPQCNSSKGNVDWRTFVNRYEKYQKNTQILQRIQEFIDENIEEYEYNKEDWEESTKFIDSMLDELKKKARNIKLTKAV